MSCYQVITYIPAEFLLLSTLNGILKSAFESSALISRAENGSRNAIIRIMIFLIKMNFKCEANVSTQYEKT